MFKTTSAARVQLGSTLRLYGVFNYRASAIAVDLQEDGTGVVDQHVDFTERFCGLLHRAVNLVVVTNIGLDRQGAATGGAPAFPALGES